MPLIFMRPALYKQNANELPWVYEDRGTGATMAITAYTPQNAQTPNMPFRPLGSLSLMGYNTLDSNMQWENAWLAMPGTPGSLADPLDFRQMWNDKGSHGDYDGSVWYAYSPLGYNSSGDLWVKGYNKPATNSMYVVTNECLQLCQEKPQLIYNDRHSGANMALSMYSLGVAKLGVPSGDNLGLSRAYQGYVDVPQSNPFNLCIKKECIRTVQLNDFTLASITYDTSVIDPAKSKGNQFHHQSLVR